MSETGAPKLSKISIFLIMVLVAASFFIYRYATRVDRFFDDALSQLSGDEAAEGVRNISLDSGDHFSVMLEHS